MTLASYSPTFEARYKEDIRSNSSLAILFRHAWALLLRRGRGRVVHCRGQRGRRGSIVCGEVPEKAETDGARGVSTHWNTGFGDRGRRARGRWSRKESREASCRALTYRVDKARESTDRSPASWQTLPPKRSSPPFRLRLCHLTRPFSGLPFDYV